MLDPNDTSSFMPSSPCHPPRSHPPHSHNSRPAAPALGLEPAQHHISLPCLAVFYGLGISFRTRCLQELPPLFYSGNGKLIGLRLILTSSPLDLQPLPPALESPPDLSNEASRRRLPPLLAVSTPFPSGTLAPVRALDSLRWSRCGFPSANS